MNALPKKWVHPGAPLDRWEYSRPQPWKEMWTRLDEATGLRLAVTVAHLDRPTYGWQLGQWIQGSAPGLESARALVEDALIARCERVERESHRAEREAELDRQALPAGDAVLPF